VSRDEFMELFMNRTFLRRASFVLNVVLAVAAIVLARHRPELAPVASVKTVGEAPVAPPIFNMQAPHYPETAAAADKRRWLVDQLRAMGVPNKILARVVWADLDKGWTKHATEVALEYHGDPDVMGALQLETDKSKDSEMRAALGEEGFMEWDHENMLREVSRNKIQLTAAETDQAYDLWKWRQQRQLDLQQAQSDGTMDPADIADAMGKAEAEYNQQMKEALGDERYAKMQQTDNVSAAASLQQEVASAQPSDSQFQALLKAQQQWNQQRQTLDEQFQNDPTSTAYAAQIKALDAARSEDYRRVLGDDAFAALQKQQDPGYTQMKKYESLWNLDDDSIDSVYGAMKYYQKAAADYQTQARALEAGGQNVDWGGVNKKLEQFAEQTEQSLAKYLGTDRYNRMAQNGVFQIGLPDMTGHSKPTR
jgi:hypothetical protein